LNKWYIIIIAAFLLPVFAFGVYSMFDADAEVSLTENRTLATAPKFTTKALFDGKLIPDFEKYYNDTFPMRERLINLNQDMNQLYYFSVKGSKDDVMLVIPKDNENIAQGGEALNTPPPAVTPAEPSAGSALQSTEPSPTPELLPDLENPTADLNTGIIIIVGDRAMEICNANTGVMEKYADAVNRINDKLPEVRVINLVTPNGSAFYAPEEYRTGNRDQQEIISSVYSYLSDDVVTVDAYSELRRHAEDYLFFRTDHHWTQLGAYYAYVAFCASLDLEPCELDAFIQGTIDDFIGSMYTYTSGYPQSKALKNNPDTVYYYRPDRDFSARVYPNAKLDDSQAWNAAVIAGKVSATNKYLCFISGDNPVMKITTDVGNGKRIVVIKESYGNAFVPFLVNHYEEIYVVDPRKFSGKDTPSIDIVEFANRVEADDLLVIDYPLVVSSQGYVNVLNNITPD
jgi:hypothetical protein